MLRTVIWQTFEDDEEQTLKQIFVKAKQTWVPSPSFILLSEYKLHGQTVRINGYHTISRAADCLLPPNLNGSSLVVRIDQLSLLFPSNMILFGGRLYRICDRKDYFSGFPLVTLLGDSINLLPTKLLQKQVNITPANLEWFVQRLPISQRVNFQHWEGRGDIKYKGPLCMVPI